MYDKGYGVPEDDVTAVKWFARAAEQGNAIAQFNLGALYASGIEGFQDNISAYMWISISGSNGVEKASEALDFLKKRMSDEEVNIAQRHVRECVLKKYHECR
jgi:TPR repeat protein